MTPEQYVQQKAAASGSSFYYAFLFLPPARRAAITAFYAFCREVDDVVDEVHEPSVAQAKLAWWDGEIARGFAGAPTHPTMQALMAHTAAFGIEEAPLHAIVEGCRMDLSQTRYLDFPALARYCHLVAGVVGELSARIFGQTEPATTEYAHKLGLALQLTNIIRDVGEDARRGRIYLPQETLARHQVSETDLLEGRYSDAFRSLMSAECARAEALYDAAMALLPPEDRRDQRTGLIMAAIYRALLREIAADDFRVLHQRIALTPIRKLWLAWKTWVFTR